MTFQRNIVLQVPFAFSCMLLLITYFRSSLFSDRVSLAAPNVASVADEGNKPRYIFVDLGANRADSLETFLKHKNAKFDYDFPCPDWATHDQAEIYLFEANPHFNPALIEAKERYSALGIKINIFPSTVVDVRDGTRTFFLDTVTVDADFLGSSIYADHPNVIQSQNKGTELSTINISRWLLMNTLPRDFVVVKMDIEGAEYEVVPHMVAMGAWTVVDHLLVEWHYWLPELVNFNHDMAQTAVNTLRANGVNLPQYDSPS